MLKLRLFIYLTLLAPLLLFAKPPTLNMEQINTIKAHCKEYSESPEEYKACLIYLRDALKVYVKVKYCFQTTDEKNAYLLCMDEKAID